MLENTPDFRRGYSGYTQFGCGRSSAAPLWLMGLEHWYFQHQLIGDIHANTSSLRVLWITTAPYYLLRPLRRILVFHKYHNTEQYPSECI
jgi:hypothetical protein